MDSNMIHLVRMNLGWVIGEVADHFRDVGCRMDTHILDSGDAAAMEFPLVPRLPSPVSRSARVSSRFNHQQEHDVEHRTVQRELALNGQEHVFVRASELVSTSVKEWIS